MTADKALTLYQTKELISYFQLAKSANHRQNDCQRLVGSNKQFKLLSSVIVASQRKKWPAL